MSSGRSETAQRFGTERWSRDLFLVLGASFAVGLCAQAEIRLPSTPVPITLQPFALFVLAALLGSRRGASASHAYLAEGAAGLPFFAGGAAGIGHLLGPTGGYLLGFVPTAYCVGFLAERGWGRTPVRAFLAMAVGSVVLFASGLAWLAAFVPRSQLLHAGLYPFIAGDVVKMLAAAALLPSLGKLAGRSARR